MIEKFNISFTNIANKDILDTIEYFTSVLSSKSAANSLLNKIEQSIDQIKIFPFSFPDCSYFNIPDGNIRHVIIDNYVLVFQVDIIKYQIVILRFIYAKRDLKSLFED